MPDRQLLSPFPASFLLWVPQAIIRCLPKLILGAGRQGQAQFIIVRALFRDTESPVRQHLEARYRSPLGAPVKEGVVRTVRTVTHPVTRSTDGPRKTGKTSSTCFFHFATHPSPLTTECLFSYFMSLGLLFRSLALRDWLFCAVVACTRPINGSSSPRWVAQLVRVSSSTATGCRFDPWSGYIREATN